PPPARDLREAPVELGDRQRPRPGQVARPVLAGLAEVDEYDGLARVDQPLDVLRAHRHHVGDAVVAGARDAERGQGEPAARQGTAGRRRGRPHGRTSRAMAVIWTFGGAPWSVKRTFSPMSRPR